MEGDGRNNKSNSTGNVEDDETKATSAVEQLQDGSIPNLGYEHESACCKCCSLSYANAWQYFTSHTEYLSTFLLCWRLS